MNKSITNIITDVRKALDEEALNDSDMISGSDDSELDSVIALRAVEAADFVHLRADIAQMALDATKTIQPSSSDIPPRVDDDEEDEPTPWSLAETGVPTPTSLGTDSSNIPATDMLRFLTAYADGWKAPVSALAIEGSAEHAMALDEFVGASPERPVAILSSSDIGRTITLLPVSHAGFFVRYIPKAVLGASNALDIDANLYEAYINYLSGITLLSLGDDRANDFIELSYNQLGISPTAK